MIAATTLRTSVMPWLLLLSLMLAGGLYIRNALQDPSWFPLQFIEVKGEFSHLDRSHLEQVVAGAMGGGFFTADIYQIQQAVQALPWVHQVYITRRWPDKLEMRVVEQAPIAKWQTQGLVNADGEVFRPSNRDTEIVLQLYGMDDEAPQVVDFYQQVNSRAIQQGMVISSFGRDVHRDWIVKFDNGLKITMGRDDAAKKLSRFLALLPSIRIAGKQAESVDLRYDQGFSVRWIELPAAALNDGAT